MITCTRPSTLAKVLDDGAGLMDWMAATTLSTVAHHKDLRDRLAILGATTEVDEWREFKGLHKSAQERRGKPEAEAGTNIHKVMEGLVAGIDLEGVVPDDVLVDARAALGAMTELGLDPHVSEEFVVNLHDLPEPYAGTRDLLALHRDSGWLVVVDLKTTNALGGESYRALSWAVQLAMYANASPYYEKDGARVERDRWGRPKVDPALVLEEERNVNTSAGLIVEVERGTGRSAVHRVDLIAGWEYAELACKVRAARKAPVLL